MKIQWKYFGLWKQTCFLFFFFTFMFVFLLKVYCNMRINTAVASFAPYSNISTICSFRVNPNSFQFKSWRLLLLHWCWLLLLQWLKQYQVNNFKCFIFIAYLFEMLSSLVQTQLNNQPALGVSTNAISESKTQIKWGTDLCRDKRRCIINMKLGSGRGPVPL